MVTKMVELLDHEDPWVASKACSWLADRLWGKPKESLDIELVHKQLRIVIDARDQAQPANNEDAC